MYVYINNSFAITTDLLVLSISYLVALSFFGFAKLTEVFAFSDECQTAVVSSFSH